MLDPPNIPEEPKKQPKPKPQTQSEMGGGGRPPRKTAVGTREPARPEPKPEFISGEKKSKPPYQCVLAREASDGSAGVNLRLTFDSRWWALETQHKLLLDLASIALRLPCTTASQLMESNEAQQLIANFESQLPKSSNIMPKARVIQGISGADEKKPQTIILECELEFFSAASDSLVVSCTSSLDTIAVLLELTTMGQVPPDKLRSAGRDLAAHIASSKPKSIRVPPPSWIMQPEQFCDSKSGASDQTSNLLAQPFANEPGMSVQSYLRHMFAPWGAEVIPRRFSLFTSANERSYAEFAG